MVFTRTLEELEDLELDWTRVLSDSVYGISSTYHTTLNDSPG